MTRITKYLSIRTEDGRNLFETLTRFIEETTERGVEAGHVMIREQFSIGEIIHGMTVVL